MPWHPGSIPLPTRFQQVRKFKKPPKSPTKKWDAVRHSDKLNNKLIHFSSMIFEIPLTEPFQSTPRETTTPSPWAAGPAPALALSEPRTVR